MSAQMHINFGNSHNCSVTMINKHEQLILIICVVPPFPQQMSSVTYVHGLEIHTGHVSVEYARA